MRLPLVSVTPFLLFMKTEVDSITYINENIATNVFDDYGNGLLIICAIKEAARKWEVCCFSLLQIHIDISVFVAKFLFVLNGHILNLPVQYQDTPEDLKAYFSRRSKAINRGNHFPNPDKKKQNDFIRELGSQTGFFGTLLEYRAEWFLGDFQKKSIGWQVIELYLYWNQMNKKLRKKFNKLWRECNGL